MALLDGERVLAQHDEPSRNHSRTLLPAIDRLLSERGLEPADMGMVAVGIGPGSFTGVRVGLALAKSLAFGLGLPLVGVSTLRALAIGCVDDGRAGEGIRLCPALDALKAEVYCASYVPGARGLDECEEEAARDPRTWAAGLAAGAGACLLAGSGAQRYREVFTDMLGVRAWFPDDEKFHRVRAAAIGTLALERLERGAHDDPRTLEPNYCRLSEAELARARNKS